MNLEQLQRAMGAAVMQPLTLNEEMQQISSSGRSMCEVASEFIKPNSRLTSFERLEIYNRQYWFRLQGAFAEDFPALRALIGEKRFEALANAYLSAHPSRSFTLRNLGAKLHDWLSNNPSWAGPRISAALDVIRVEWACVVAFDEAEHVPLNVKEMLGVGGDSLIHLQPHIQLLALSYPADDLVLEMHQQEKKELSEAGAKAEDVRSKPRKRLHFRKRPTWLAIHRSDLSLYYKRMTRSEYLTLGAIKSGMTLADCLDAGFDGSRISVAGRIQRVQTWFATWAQLGWICKAS